MKPKLTDKEQIFLDCFLDSDKIHPGNAAYWLLAKKLMEKMVYDHDMQTNLVTDRAYDQAFSILYKIAMLEAQECIEEMLDDAA